MKPRKHNDNVFVCKITISVFSNISEKNENHPPIQRAELTRALVNLFFVMLLPGDSEMKNSDEILFPPEFLTDFISRHCSPLVEQEKITLPEHLRSSSVFVVFVLLILLLYL
jgi:hypothetical protein